MCWVIHRLCYEDTVRNMGTRTVFCTACALACSVAPTLSRTPRESECKKKYIHIYMYIYTCISMGGGRLRANLTDGLKWFCGRVSCWTSTYSIHGVDMRPMAPGALGDVGGDDEDGGCASLVSETETLTARAMCRLQCHLSGYKVPREH